MYVCVSLCKPVYLSIFQTWKKNLLHPERDLITVIVAVVVVVVVVVAAAAAAPAVAAAVAVVYHFSPLLVVSYHLPHCQLIC